MRIIASDNLNTNRRVEARTEKVEILTPEGGEQAIVIHRCVRTFLGNDLISEQHIDHTVSVASLFTTVPEYVHLGVDIRDALDLFCARTGRN